MRALCILMGIAGVLRAQAPDPLVADPQHYKLEIENQWVRVLTSGKVALCDPVPGSKKIADGSYDPETRQLRLMFEDGTAQEVGL